MFLRNLFVSTVDHYLLLAQVKMRSIYLYMSSLITLSAAATVPFFIEESRNAHVLERRQAVNITWPYQTFVSEPSFLPPIPEITKTGRTAPGYQFLAQQGVAAAQQAAMIMTDDGELVWQSDPKLPFPPTNFSPQMLNGKPVLV
jgi:hypothetical protein